MTSPRPFDLRKALASLAQYEQAHPGFLQVLGAAGRLSVRRDGARSMRSPAFALLRTHGNDRPPARPSAPHHTARERAQGAAAWLATGAVLYIIALVLLLYSEIRTCLIVRSQVRVPILYICILCVFL